MGDMGWIEIVTLRSVCTFAYMTTSGCQAALSTADEGAITTLLPGMAARGAPASAASR